MTVPDVTREDLMARLAEVGLDKDETIDKALNTAFASHARQKRDDGAPYLEQHIYPVALCVIDYYDHTRKKVHAEYVAAALLHDAPEDNPKLHLVDLEPLFGAGVATIVTPLVKKDWRLFPGETEQEMREARDQEYFNNIRDAPTPAKIIKLADRLNNLQCLQLSPIPGKLEEYIAETEAFHLPLAQNTSVHFYDQINKIVQELKNAN